MKVRSQRSAVLTIALSLAVCLSLPAHWAGETKGTPVHYKVLPATLQGNLAVFPVTADSLFDASTLLTLEEGIRSGEVIVTEARQSAGLIRPRPAGNLIWTERLPSRVVVRGAQVNELAIVNRSGRPLLLLAGEIVTGGKQDRVVGKDRIIPAHSEPVSLDVFCVEPHRWTETSAKFGALHSSMAQPSVRLKAMAEQNQQEVWDQVAKSRAAFVAGAPAAEARLLAGTSSYAAAFGNSGVQQQIDSLAVPIERSYGKLFHDLHAANAVGAVIAVNGELIWVDIFASPGLLEKYWPKLVRSYAAEALSPKVRSIVVSGATQRQAQEFVDRLDAKHETVESEPGVYRSTELLGDDFEAFILTGLLPEIRFNIHWAKMRRD